MSRSSGDPPVGARTKRAPSKESEGPHVVVRASAGTGKTHRLSSRYIELIARGVEARSILATTFTRKAAGEILERVLDRLSKAAVDAKERKELSGDVGLVLSAERCRELTVKVVRQMHRLNVGTIDSFFARVRKGFVLDLDVPPGLELVDEEADAELRSLAVLRAIEGSGLEHKELTLLIRMLASGRRKRGVHEAVLGAVKQAYNAYLASRGDEGVWKAFGAGLSAPSGDEVEELVRRVRGVEAPKTNKGEPNKNFANNLDWLVEAIDARDWSGMLQLSLVEKVIEGGGKFSQATIDDATRQVIERAIEAARRGTLVQLRDRNLSTFEFLHRFDSAYEALKTERGAMRYEDVPRAILNAGVQGRSEDLYYRLDGRIDHVLLDEFQDTSLDQFEILKPMLDELLAMGDGSRSVLCVGDVKQSLYSWRGAEPELLPALKRRWPQFVERELGLNRRSSQTILDAVNAVFERIGENTVVAGFESAKRFGAGFVPHKAFYSEVPGEVVLSAPSGDEDDEQETRVQIATFVARRVKELRTLAPEATIAVLTRTNKPIPGLILALREQEIPAVGERGNPLTDTPAAAAAISALHLADHPWDSAALFHVATSPLGEVLGVQWREDKTLNRLEGQWIASRLRMKLERDGLRAVLEKWQRRLAGSMDAAGYARFDQLVDLAGAFEEKSAGRPDDFVRLARERSVEPPGVDHGGGSDRVRVMTIHAAKGLEFDAVVLPELDKRWEVKTGSVLVDRRDEQGTRDPLSGIAAVTTYPSKEICAVDAGLRELLGYTLDRSVGEELSSLYVAMTRARRYLELVMPEIKGKRSQPSAQRVLQEALPPGGFTSKEPWHAGLKGERAPGGAECVVTFAAAKKVPAGRLARRSPSSLEGGSRQDLGDLWSAAGPLGEPGAKDRGTAFHAMFEAIEWLDVSPPRRSDFQVAMEGLGFKSSEGWVEEFVRQLRGEVAAALSRARYAGRNGDLEVRREWSFAIRESGRNATEYVLNGTIDRLVLGVERGRPVWAEVIDFKSDDVSDAALLEASVEHYRPQIEAYKRAVRAIFGLGVEAVGACLVFSGPGRVVPV